MNVEKNETVGRLLAAFILLFALAFAVACSDDGGETEDGDTSPDGDLSPDGDSTDGDENPDGDTTPDGDETDGDDEADGDAEPDADEELPACDSGVYIRGCSGRVVDATDTPRAGITAFVCIVPADNQSACLNPVFTSDDGRFAASVPEDSHCMSRMAVRLLDPNSLAVMSLVCPLDLGNGGSPSFGDIRMIETAGVTRDSLGDAAQPHAIRQGDAVLTLIPDQLFLFDTAYEDIQILHWDASAHGWPCFVDADDPPDGLLAVNPEISAKADAHGAAHVSFPNTAGLEAGTVVDLYALGGVSCYDWDNEHIEEGAWTVVESATVSANGTRIKSDSGRGLPFLTWIGWKRR